MLNGINGWPVLICMPLAAVSASARSATCELKDIVGSRELHRALSLRAVELVRRAENPDESLTALIEPTTGFHLGGGDVGRPLGQGATGARKLAELMSADTYRFLGWDYMDGPAEACLKHSVEVEFIDSRSKSISLVKFTFEDGRVVHAAGWQRSYETGPIRDDVTN